MKQKNELDLLYKAYLLNACLSKSARELFYFPFLMKSYYSSEHKFTHTIEVKGNSIILYNNKCSLLTVLVEKLGWCLII